MSLWSIWLIVSVASALAVAVDLVRRGGQKMWIMDIVWPVTALWAGPLGALFYLRYGRTDAKPPFPVVTAKAATHCGAGCTIGDVIAALIAVAAPLAIGGDEIFGEWIYAFVAAFAIGIAFQYFTIAPMRHLSLRDGVVAALKADALSLTAWQVGMYGWMAIARFALFGHPLSKSRPVFWVMMQIAMLAGFVTAYPVNALLLRRGLKEPM